MVNQPTLLPHNTDVLEDATSEQMNKKLEHVALGNDKDTLLHRTTSTQTETSTACSSEAVEESTESSTAPDEKFIKDEDATQSETSTTCSSEAVEESTKSNSAQDEEFHKDTDTLSGSKLPPPPFSSSSFWNSITHGKLYNRASEMEQLDKVYQSLSSSKTATTTAKAQFVLIQGPRGVGKTSLASSSLGARVVQEQGGFFVVGKYDQLEMYGSNDNPQPPPLVEPHSAFVSAFTGFAHDVLSRGEDYVQKVRQRVRQAVGVMGNNNTTGEERVLTDLIPQLGAILVGGARSASDDMVHTGGAVKRFKYVCRKFLRGVSSVEPLVLLFDDLHWADEASLDLVESLVTDTKNRNIIFVGTYRNDFERTATSDPTARLVSMLSRLKASEVTVTNISVGNLEEAAVQELVADVFSSLGSEKAQTLAKWLFDRTKGNLLFISELLQSLQDGKLLFCDAADGSWTWQEEEMEKENGAQCETLHDLLVQKVSALPLKTVEALKIASCLGSKVDEDMLTRLMREHVFSYLNVAADEGLLALDNVNGGWRFANDAVQEATYHTIPSAEREKFHRLTGLTLWRNLDLEELDQRICVVVGQLILGRKSSQSNKPEEGVAVAKLCLRAAERAIVLSSFQTAYAYLMHGISLLGPRSWRDEYRLTLELHNFAAEVAFCTAQFRQIEALVATITQNARTFDDTLRAQTTQVNALGSSGRLRQAIDLGTAILKALNLHLRRTESRRQLRNAFQSCRRKLKGKTSESILRLPIMNQPEKLAAMQMLNVIFLPAFIAAPDMGALIGMKMVELSLDYGLSAVSCVGFSLFGMLLCGFSGEMDEGYRLGLLGLDLYRKFNAKTWLSRVSVCFYGGVQCWNRPIRESLEPLKLAHYQGLETGDIEFAMLNASLCCFNQIDFTPIPVLEQEILGFCERMEFHGQTTALMSLRPTWQMLQNFAGRAWGDVTNLNGDITSELEIEATRCETFFFYEFSLFHKMVLSYTFGDYIKAEECAQGCQNIMNDPFGCADLVVSLFYDALTAIEASRRSSSRCRRRKLVARAKKRLVKLRHWAKHSPMNFLGKQFFVEAELAVAAGKDYHTCFAKYTSAIALSREGGFLRQTALTCERAGKYCWAQGEKEDAKQLVEEALLLYEKWGAALKVAHLKKDIALWVDE